MPKTPLSFYLYMIAVAVIVVALSHFFYHGKNSSNITAVAAKESAFDRVMRAGILRCGYIQWPEFFEIDPNTGQKSGISYDLAEAVARQLKIKIEWAEEIANDTKVAALGFGRIDTVCSADGPLDPALAKGLEFSDGFAYFPFFAYVRANETRFKTLADLNHPSVKLSTLDGDFSEAYARDYLPQAGRLALPGNANPSLLMSNVAEGKADALFMDKFTIDAYEANNPGRLKSLDSRPIHTIPLTLTLKKGEHSLRSFLNTGIQAVLNNGEAEQIFIKHAMGAQSLYRVAKPYQPPAQ